MDTEEIMKLIHEKTKPGIKPGLSRIKKVLSNIGNPQNKLKFVHVAGTNGKGSICNMIASVLFECGYKTGLFTSPFVSDFRDRIKVNGEMIPLDFLKNAVQELLPYAGDLTEFEFITVIAFKWFQIQKCDVVVLEVGLGGRLDATNVINDSLVSVITSISIDHTSILGDTIQEIAYEKCGILKNKCNVVLYPEQKKCVKDIIEESVIEREGMLKVPDCCDLHNVRSGLEGSSFIYKNRNLKLSLTGDHQVKNCITAIEALDVLNDKGFNITDYNISEGISKVKMPARFEIISQLPIIILDGSHNADGAFVLASTIKKFLNNKKLIGIFGVLKDKDYKTMTKLLAPLFYKIFTVPVENPRTLSGVDLQKEAGKYCNDVSCARDVNYATKKALSLLDDEKALIVFGSLYLASDVKKRLKFFE